MRADHDDRRRRTSGFAKATADRRDRRSLEAGNFRFDIVAGLPVHVVTVATRSETSARKRSFDKIGSGIELRVMPHVSFADFSSQLLHAGAEFFTQRNFVRR